MKTSNSAIGGWARNGVVMLAMLLAATASKAQFLDMLKDQASKALQKKIEDKPAEPPAKADGPSTPGNMAANSGQAAPPQTLQAYEGYDFVPGDTIVFEDSFEKDEDGEFPSHWNQGDGQGAVNVFAGRRAFTVTASSWTQVSPAIKASKYLSDSWTLEFDT